MSRWFELSAAWHEVNEIRPVGAYRDSTHGIVRYSFALIAFEPANVSSDFLAIV
jgi:hypothetical protein